MKAKNPETVESGVLILGEDLAHLKAAYDLAHSGIPVILYSSSDIAFSALSREEEYSLNLRPAILQLLHHPLVKILPRSELKEVRAQKNGWEAVFNQSSQFINPELCTGCRACTVVCPLTQTERTPALNPGGNGGLSRSLTLEKQGTAPCRSACPMGVNAQGYVALIRKGRFQEALDLVRENNPLPGICGRICHHPCESKCRRAEIDQPIAIRALKRFISDYELSAAPPRWEKNKTPSGEKSVAIIGSGPAGLTAAWVLARQGFAVTIFEAGTTAGGLLATGIAAYRLPKNILHIEIQAILELGVEILYDQELGRNLSLEMLRQSGYRAIIISTGAQKERHLDIPGEDLPGVCGAVAFLRKVYNREAVFPGKQVAVIGGGNAAIEAARTARRLGAKKVTLVYRRSREEMPAAHEEIEAAEAEGVELQFLLAPVAVEGGQGKISSLTVQKMKLGTPDPDGRRRPIPIPGTQEKIEVDAIIAAIGQEPVWSILPALEKSRGKVKTDAFGMTSLAGVFATGDLVSGPSTVIEAMARARATALRVAQYLEAETLPEFIPTPAPDSKDLPPLPRGLPQENRIPLPSVEPDSLLNDFSEVEKSYAPEQAIAEASRCLQCGVCSECRQCQLVCGALGAVQHLSSPQTISVKVKAIISPSRVAKALKNIADERLQLISAAKDQATAMIRGGAAAGRAMLFTAALRPSPAEAVHIPRRIAAGRNVAIYLCTCNNTLAAPEVLEEVLNYVRTRHPVIDAAILPSLCHPQGAQEVLSRLKQLDAPRVVFGSCVCCPLDFICGSCNLQRLRFKDNLLKQPLLQELQVETVNLREHCFMPHGAGAAGKIKAERLLWTAVKRVMHSSPFVEERITTIQGNITILGGNEIAVQVCKNLKAQGFTVDILSRDPIPDELRQELSSAFIRVHDRVVLGELRGQAGEFVIPYKDARGIQMHQVADLIINLSGQAEGGTGYSGATVANDFSVFASPRRGLFYLHPLATRTRFASEELSAALSSQASILAGIHRVKRGGLIPGVIEDSCRGCGQCEQFCPANAIEMQADERGIMRARVIPLNCYNCGVCVAACPCGAMQNPYTKTRMLDISVEGLLA